MNIPPDSNAIRGKTFVVTGASSGLGRGTALQLAKQGANVVLAARRGGLLEEVAAEAQAAGGTASASRRKPMICSSEKRFFTSNLLVVGIGLQIAVLLKTGGTSAAENRATGPVRDHSDDP